MLQRKIHEKIETSPNEQTKLYFKAYRNNILAEIHIILKLEENKKLQKTMQELETCHDNNKMYQAVKNIRNLKQ